MVATGIVKSSSAEFGFIKSNAVQETYGRDAFFHKTKLPDGLFEQLKPASTVEFEYQLSAEGKPQVTNILTIDGQPPTIMAPQTMMMGAVYAPAEMMMQQMMMPAQPYVAASALPQVTMAPPALCQIPAGATEVMMMGKRGWFVPEEFAIGPAGQMAPPPTAPPMMAAPAPIQPPVPAPMSQGLKRPAMNGAVPAPKQLATGVGSANPGLLDGSEVFVGTVKSSIGTNTGYGFLECETVKMQTGRDPFVHVNRVPGVLDMNLQVGEVVHFNIEHVESATGGVNSFVNRIVRA